ncbi:MAG: Nif3-like dinuclear metal center hexameric protein, partial [Pseudomonadota bacterium]
EVGNAATLGRRIGLEQQQPFGDHRGSPTGIKGILSSPLSAAQLQEQLKSVLDHRILLASPNRDGLIQSIGIITGGANSEWRKAIADSLDAYITGEMSEHDWHESREAGIHMLAGGHNATEQFGIQALMEKTRETLPVECFFIPSDNPA